MRKKLNMIESAKTMTIKPNYYFRKVFSWRNLFLKSLDGHKNFGGHLSPFCDIKEALHIKHLEILPQKDSLARPTYQPSI